MLLEIKNLVVEYYGSLVLRELSLQMEEGSTVAIVGANGAGKTTLLRTISGLKRAAAGEIHFDGKNITAEKPYNIVKLGIGHCPERSQLFPDMTVKQNLLMGAYSRKDRTKIAGDLEEIFDRFPILKERQKQQASLLSGGEQQMAAIGRALMSKPKLLLMDEPSIGLAPKVVEELQDIIGEINKQLGVTVLLVEQNVRMALSTMAYGYVLESGEIVLEGNAKELINSDLIRKAYLGI